ncbi:hypothetical protein PHJA_001758800 [Phtheirospermum japonicum]|uniref:F-box domain-containing protein n=1 Tax=Phtheirospermum japonicum TaxID=374723 RepID=A0A830C612_9LAMI|nr:hypothetical protein PHJA_001758800 [Phtheirospermum japonicum]
MPDEILVSIIARLPTTSTTRTSILSRRWKNLCEFVPDVELDFSRWPHAWYQEDWYRSGVTINLLKNFVTHRLSSSSKIRSFKLRCCLTNLDLNQFENCICSLGKSGLERLTLSFCNCCMSSDNNHPFPSRLLSEMPSVNYFRLVGYFLKPNLTTKYSNLLQTLSLTCVKAFPGGLECVLSNCSMLQSLSAVYCVFPSKIRFCGPNLPLKSLMMGSCQGIEEIEFYASNLVTFDFHHSQVVNFIFDHFPHLQSIYLEIKNNNIMPYVFGKLATDLPRLESLSFASRADPIYQVNTGIGTFRELRRLEMHLFGPPKINLLAVIPILESCPHLLEFHLDTANLQCNEEQVTDHNVFHSELRKVEIWGFKGTDNQIELALYLLRNALVLEQMRVCCCSKLYSVLSRAWHNLPADPWSPETREDIRNKLQGQALSENAQLIIQHAS